MGKPHPDWTPEQTIIVMALGKYCDKVYWKQAAGIIKDLEEGGYKLVKIEESKDGKEPERDSESIEEGNRSGDRTQPDDEERRNISTGRTFFTY